MRRRQRQTPLDMIPIMGLMTLLIPLLLMNQSTGAALATVDTNAPACCAPSTGVPPQEEPFTPSVVLGVEHIRVLGVPGDEPSFAVDDLVGLGDHLRGLAAAHTHTGNAVIVPDSAVSYDTLIQVMDTVRPHFPSSTLASGVQ